MINTHNVVFISVCVISLPPQVVHGSHGLSPAAPVRDFVLRHYSAFTGGVFWLNCSSQDLLTGALDLVNTVSMTLHTDLSVPFMHLGLARVHC